MSHYPDAPAAPQPAARPSPWKALIGVITEPGATFRAFEGRVPIFAPYLILMVLGLAALAMQLPMILATSEEMMVQNPTFTPEMASVTKWTSVITVLLGGLAGPWIAGVITAAFAAFFGQFQEERVSFGTYMGMAGYARMPLALAGLLSGGLTLALGKQAMGLSISLAVLAPEGSGAFLKTFLGTINPFDIWYYITLAIGFGAVHRAKASRGVGLVATIYVLSLLMMTGLAALGSRFAPQM